MSFVMLLDLPNFTYLERHSFLFSKILSLCILFYNVVFVDEESVFPFRAAQLANVLTQQPEEWKNMKSIFFLNSFCNVLKTSVHDVHKRLIHTLSLIIVCSKSLSMSAASLCNWMASSTLPFLDAFSACRCNKWALFSIIEGNLTSMPAFT